MSSEAAARQISRGAFSYVHLFLFYNVSSSSVPKLANNVFLLFPPLSHSVIFTDPEKAKEQFPVPIFQCLQVKPLGNQQPGAAGGERYRVVLSDMDHYVQTMLATQASHVVHDGKLVRGCMVRIKSYQANSVKGKK